MNQSIQQDSLIEPPSIREVEAFLVEEARLLDERRFEEWMALFDEKGFYWAPSSINQESPLTEVSIFYDDHELMIQRITRLRHERIHSQIPHSRTVHIVSNASITEFNEETGELTVRSKFLLLEYRPSIPEGSQRIFGGDYQHTLKKAGGNMTILSKKATLVNCDAAFGALALYF